MGGWRQASGEGTSGEGEPATWPRGQRDGVILGFDSSWACRGMAGRHGNGGVWDLSGSRSLGLGDGEKL